MELEVEDEESYVLSVAEERLGLVAFEEVAHDCELAILLLIAIVDDVVDEVAFVEAALVGGNALRDRPDGAKQSLDFLT